MRYILICALWGCLSIGLKASGQEASFRVGADISFLEEVEAGGGVFSEAGITADPLAILASHGFNAARLRIWHTPEAGKNGLEETLAAARRAKDAGLDVLLDFHYSDNWADPGKQFVPAAWDGSGYEVLRDSVRAYSFRVIHALARQQTLPEIVQIGNEIICGMLWDTGRVCDAFNTSAQWSRLAGLLAAAREGVMSAVPAGESVQIMVHIDRGGDNGGSRWFYDHLQAQGVEFDLIGLSYYPWWHGTLDDLSNNMADLAVRYGKDIIVVETGYPWTLQWKDNTNNLVGEAGQLLDAYPATVAGQEAYFRELLRRVKATPGQRGRGIYLWEPIAISAPGFGSVMENLALFDFSGAALASLKAFEPESATGLWPGPSPAATAPVDAYPNPFTSLVTIVYPGATQTSPLHAHVVDSLGRTVAVLGAGTTTSRGVMWHWEGRDGSGRRVPAGVYLCAIASAQGTIYVRIVRQ
ncbi:MAG: glycosyl hydrolase 53 family protein [Rhodothermales bacterium]